MSRPAIGLNLPWIDYGWDFGCVAGANDAGAARGVHSTVTAARVHDAFARLRAAGIRDVRWFLLCDARAGVRFGETGLPLGLDAFVERDVKAALALAAAYDVRILFSLLNYQFSLDDSGHPSGVRQFGHGPVLATAAGRDALVERVLVPLVDLLAADPHRSQLSAIELMNEPELLTPGQYRLVHDREVLRGADEVPLAGLKELARRVQRRAHERGLPFTVGSVSAAACLNWVDVLDASRGDFLQFHHYGSLRDLTRFDFIRANGLPVVVGELPADGCAGSRLADSLALIAELGFAGAFGWSLLKGEPAIPMADLADYQRCLSAHGWNLPPAVAVSS